MNVVKMSEARLNDLVYLTLKKLYFEPAMNANPRECDIRICMDMACPERITPFSAILRPDEVAGKSHHKFYDVDTDKVLDECVLYLTDHWRVEWPTELSEEVLVATRKEYFTKLVEAIMEMAEDQCGG